MAYRALLTEREREVLSGNAEVSRNYRNQIRYRVREKIATLATDLELLAEHQPALAQDLHETVIATLEVE